MLRSEISKVRVYRLGAMVTRRFQVCSPWPEELSVPGLPLSLTDSSVRIECEGQEVWATSPSVRLHAAEFEHLTAEPNEVERRENTQELQRARRQINTLNTQVELLQSVSVPQRAVVKGAPRASPIRARIELEGFTFEQVDSCLNKIAVLVERVRVLTQEKQRLDFLWQQSQASRFINREKLSKEVCFSLNGPERTVWVNIHYLVPGARWTPRYMCHLNKDGTSAKVVMKAGVCQQTGEDWSGVALELVTSSPQVFGELPKLKSLRIGKEQTYSPPGRAAQPPPPTRYLFDDFDAVKLPSTPTLSKVFVPPPRALPLSSELCNRSRVPEEPMFGGAAACAEPEPVMEVAPPPAPAPRRQPVRAKKLKRRAPAKPMAQPMSTARADRAESDSFLFEEAKMVPQAKERTPNFGDLMLAPASSPSRGALTLVDPRTRYLSGFAGKKGGDAVLRDIDAAVRLAKWCGTQQKWKDVGALTEQFAFTYVAALPVTIPGDGGAHTVPIEQVSGECTTTYVVVPREDLGVFRQARILNRFDGPLLPGAVDVFVDDAFVLTTKMPYVPAKAFFDLGLGVEQAIRVVRNTRFEERRSGRGVVAMAELHHWVEITVNNQLRRAVEVEVRERLPTPEEDAEVVVEEVEVEPSWQPFHQRNQHHPLVGGHRWQLEVAGKSAAQCAAHYVVKIYANNEVVGGNRRES